MGKRRRVPEDLMGTILGESPGVLSEGRAHPKPREADREASPTSDAGEVAFSWEERPERVGIAFNLSKQLAAELERLREEFRPEGEARPARSEIAEVALRIAVEDVRERGRESELWRRLSRSSPADETASVTGGRTDGAGQTVRRSVDESGFIVETTYDENGEIVDEDVVGSLSDLPVEDEVLDDQGRIISRVRDESGTVIEQILDDRGTLLGVKFLGEG